MDKDLAVSLSQEARMDIDQIIREWWETVILRDLFASAIGDNLLFKGGTALRLAYGSPRFSEDLDFSMIKKFPFANFKDAILSIEKKYVELKIRDVADKFYTYVAQYRIKEAWRPIAISVKIEVSKRQIDNPDSYSLITIGSQISNLEALGNVMKIENIYQEKLRALQTRVEPRDLFDLWYLGGVLKKQFRPKAEKFEKRILKRDLRKYLPSNYWKVIDTLGGR